MRLLNEDELLLVSGGKKKKKGGGKKKPNPIPPRNPRPGPIVVPIEPPCPRPIASLSA